MMIYFGSHLLHLCVLLFTIRIICVDVAEDYKLAIALEGEIGVIDRNGSDYTVITKDVYRPMFLSFDPVHGYLYFIADDSIKRVRYSLTDNNIIETVVSNRSGSQLGCLTVDALHRYIYWSIWSDSINQTIKRTSLDGSEEMTIQENIKYVYSIAVVPKNDWLYYSDYNDGIYRCRLNGSNCHTILSGYTCYVIEVERRRSKLYCHDSNNLYESTLEGDNIRWLDGFSAFIPYNFGVQNYTLYYNDRCNIKSFDLESNTYSPIWSKACVYDITIMESIALPECNNFAWTDKDERRSSDYVTDLAVDQPISDHVIVEGWYRHSGWNGDIIPTAPPGVNHCGTIHPIWLLKGKLPTEEELNVSGTACVQTEDDICKHSLPINITKCGGYYVYYLTPTPENSAYCFGSGEVACPAGMSSETGYYTGCSSSYPHIELTVSVRAELIHGQTFKIPSLPLTPSLEAVFRCHFDITDPDYYVYDIKWYINGNEVKEYINILYVNINSTVLKNSDWVDKYRMNMQVICAMRLRYYVNSVPGPYYRSPAFDAGLFPDKQEYTVIEGQSIDIPFRSTVPVGCMASHVNLTSHCSVSIYLHQPDKNNGVESCTNNIASKDIIFKAQFCGIKLTTTDWEETHNLEVFGYSEGLYNVRGRRTFIRLSTSSLSFLNKHWQHIQVPEIKINVIDKDASLSNRICQSYNDPHISTYDGKYYDFMEIGEFVMYRNDKGPYWVHALLTNCGWNGATCHCGVAIRSRHSLFIFRTCKIVSSSKTEFLTTPISTVKICDENDLVISSGTNRYKVTLPIGTEIALFISRWSGFIGAITIKPSIYDIGEAKGLCGLPSITKDPSDDFMHRTDGPASNDQQFAKSWRITSPDEQLFVEEPMFLQSYVVDLSNGLRHNTSDTYCLCEGQAGSTDDLADYNTAHCNLTGSTEYCSTDSTSTTGSVITSQYTECRTSRRRRRSAVDTSDDVIDNTPLEIDDVLTTSMTGGTSFLSDTIEAMIVNVMTELSRNESLYINNSTETGGQTMLEQIMSQLCKNKCSSNGECIQGSCRCRDSYIGEDCSLRNSEPPRNISVPSSGLCRMGERACKRTNIFGNFVSDTVWYRIRQYKIEDDKMQYISDWQTKKAEYRNIFMVTVDLGWSRRKRSTSDLAAPEGYDIGLSYDGQNYGEYVSIVIYDENCYSCNSSLVCVLMENCKEKVKDTSSEGKLNTVTIAIGVGFGVAVILIVIAFMIYRVKCTEPKSKIDVIDVPIDAKDPKIDRENTISDIQFQFEDILFQHQENFDRQRPPQLFWKPRDQFKT